MEQKLDEIIKKLTAVESLLQRLPEVQAAIFLQMLEQAQEARLSGLTTHDIWEVKPVSDSAKEIYDEFSRRAQEDRDKT